MSLVLCLLTLAALIVPAAAEEVIEGELISAKVDYVHTDIDADWYRAAVENYGYPEIFGESELFEPHKQSRASSLCVCFTARSASPSTILRNPTS